MKHDMNFMDGINRKIEARKAARRILDVDENADGEQLKRAYRQAAVKFHPDHNSGSDEANKKFTLVKCAYELLAFDKPCDELLSEINSWQGVPQDDKYNLESHWGRFLWWREKFYGSVNKGGEEDEKKQQRPNSCI
jgi:hypothetical protein